MDKQLLAEARTSRRAFGGILFFSLLAGVLIIAQALILSGIIDRLFLGTISRTAVAPLFLLAVGIIFLRGLNQFLLQLAATAVSTKVKRSLREDFVAQLIKLGPAQTQLENSGELSLALTDGIDSLDNYFQEYLPALFNAVLIPLTILFFVFPVDQLTFVIFLLTAPLIPLFMVLIGRGAGALAATRYRQLGQLSAHFLDVMQGLFTLKLFNRSKAQVDTIARISEQYRETTLSVLRLAFLSAFTLELLATISVAVVAVEIGLKLLYGRMVFHDALFLLILAPEFYQPLRQLGARFHAGRDGTAVFQRLAPILHAETALPETGCPVPPFDQITFDKVSVAFADGKRPALHNITLTLPRGQHIALVGTTGSGKSTLADLLLRFQQPNEGRIFLGSATGAVNLLDVNPAAWRRQLNWVPQRGYLFNESVADNIRLADLTAVSPEIEAAAQAASADAFITQLPHGYDTFLGENGARLSGGQAQRIALARAFLRPAALYIFDEATANLDAVNEANIQQAIADLPPEAIVLTIAHRLNTVRAANKIVVLDGGRIVETGSHHELIQAQGAYYQLLLATGVAADG